MRWDPRETQLGVPLLDSLVVTVNTKGSWRREMPGLICIPSLGQALSLKELTVKLEKWTRVQVSGIG